MQYSAAIDACHRLDSIVEPRQQAPYRPLLEAMRRGQRDHGRALGRSVALIDAQPEFVFPRAGNVGAELLSAGDDPAHRIEIERVRMLGIVAEERAGAE